MLFSSARRFPARNRLFASKREVSMRFGRIICMSAIATCIAFSSFAQGLPKANKPEDVGFSSERLKRVTTTIKLTCRPNLLNSRPQRIWFYSSSKFLCVFNGLLTSNWALGFPKYTTGFQSHTLWFSLFLVVARRSSAVSRAEAQR